VSGPARALRVLHVTASEGGGGADGVAARLAAGLRGRGHEAWLAVGQRSTTDSTTESHVVAIPHDDAPVWRWSGYAFAYDGLRRLAATHPGRGAGRLARLLRRATHPEAAGAWWTGLEDFDFPGTARLLSLPPAPPEILHAHNLHGGYFDLRQLGPLSARLPVCLTLHDAWLLSGHCAHAFDCDRWKTGCGACPDLTIEPAVRRDRTAENWQRKRAILASSRVHVATPSQWLMDRVSQSLLPPAVATARVIPNGIDTAFFSPGDRVSARAALGLPADSAVVLVTTGEPGAPWRDGPLLVDALDRAAAAFADRPLRFLAAGRASLSPRELPARVASRVIAPGHLSPDGMREAYRAADVYVHAARADTFPTAVLEALACGLPVVATRVGGIPEQVNAVPLATVVANHGTRVDGTGVLIDPGDAAGMAEAIRGLLTSAALRAELGARASADARARFSLDAQVRACEDWYCAILSRRDAA
jgi:glycosyltransferase involved in cell wall biosynthesis